MNKENAVKVAAQLAEKKAAGIEKVVFDRNGYLYHVVAAFADSLREKWYQIIRVNDGSK